MTYEPPSQALRSISVRELLDDPHLGLNVRLVAGAAGLGREIAHPPGRPVITQETGFSKHLPSGKGLFGFTTMDDVLAAVDSIETDWAGHCRAAREIAREYFEAEKVVASLMERAGL